MVPRSALSLLGSQEPTIWPESTSRSGQNVRVHIAPVRLFLRDSLACPSGYRHGHSLKPRSVIRATRSLNIANSSAVIVLGGAPDVARLCATTAGSSGVSAQPSVPSTQTGINRKAWPQSKAASQPGKRPKAAISPRLLMFSAISKVMGEPEGTNVFRSTRGPPVSQSQACPPDTQFHDTPTT